MIKKLDPLSSIRQQIDTIDNQMLKLIDQRLELAKSLRSLKPTDRAAWAPAREHALFQRLLDQKSATFPAKTMISMWSALITCSLMTQGPMVLLCQNEQLNSWAQIAFPGAPSKQLDMQNWQLQTVDTKGAIAVLSFPSPDQSWWLNTLGGNTRLYVQTILPKWPPNAPKAVCLSVDRPNFRAGQVCWTVVDKRARHLAESRVIAQTDAVALIETKTPIDNVSSTDEKLLPPVFIGCFFPALVHENINDRST